MCKIIRMMAFASPGCRMFGMAALVSLVLAGVPVRPARGANAAYEPVSNGWDGLAALIDLAEDIGVTVETGDTIDMETLGSRDALLIVYPKRDLPVSSLTRFMRRGGRVALADDFGAGTELLRAFQIGRHDPQLPDRTRWARDNPALLIAEPVRNHPLTRDVVALVTNHPQVVHHAQLDPVFAFDPPRGAVVLTGMVGQGRLVAIGDASLLINNMLAFRGNRRFAANLLRYLATKEQGRVFLATPETRILPDDVASKSPSALRALEQGFRRVAGLQLPPPIVWLIAAVLALALAAAAVTTVPRRSPYRAEPLLALPPTWGGFAGRVGYHHTHPSRLWQPLLVFKFELEGEILQRLGMRGRPLVRDVAARLRTLGVSAADIATLERLLSELDDVHRRQDQPGGAPRISRRRFHRMVRDGQRIMDAVRAKTEHA